MISACLTVSLIDLKICTLANLDLHNQRNFEILQSNIQYAWLQRHFKMALKYLRIFCLMTVEVKGVLSLILDLIYFLQDSTVIGSNCTADKDCVAGTSLPVGNGKPLKEIQNYLLPLS